MKPSLFTLAFSLIGLLTFHSCQPKTTNDTSSAQAISTAQKVTPADHPDYKAVHAALLDYVEGLYLVDSSRIERSVDTTLRKVGYWWNEEEGAWRDNLPMTFAQLRALAARWNAKGDRIDENTPKEIEIYDINSKSASAKLTAAWGIDYFHLAKVDGQWRIMNVLWQSMPEEKAQQ